MRPTLSQALAALLGTAPAGLIPEQPTWVESTTIPTEVTPTPVSKPTAGKPTKPAAAPAAPAAAGDIRALSAQADREFKDALDKQRKGDWAGYGESLKKLQKTLEELQKAAGGK